MFFFCALTAVLGMVNAWIWGVPLPLTQDEFAYLLGADTFAQGRLTNPTPEFWPFYESAHAFFTPTYMSKYQPAQSGFMALGQVLFGMPYAGVLISAACLFCAIYWMLKAIVPTRWALVGTLLAVAHFMHRHYWTMSYYGGNVVSLGSVLILSAYLYSRIERKPAYIWAFLVGCALLFFSRPFECGCLTLAVLGLFFWDVYKGDIALRPYLKSVLGNVCLASVLVVGFQLYYNWRLTGSVWLMPYLHHAIQYNYASLLWMLPDPTPLGAATERQEFIHRFGETREPEIINSFSPLARASYLLIRFIAVIGVEFFYLPLLIVLIVVFSGRSILPKRLLLIATAAAVPLVLENTNHIHYAAPLLMVLIPAFTYILWRFYSTKKNLFRYGVVLLALIFALYPQVHMWSMPAELSSDAYYNLATFSKHRQAFIDKQIASGKKTLVFVEYSKEPGTFYRVAYEWVQNLKADIDNQPIIWAHDLGDDKNRKLCRYYKDRVVWRVFVDRYFPNPVPYDACKP